MFWLGGKEKAGATLRDQSPACTNVLIVVGSGGVVKGLMAGGKRLARVTTRGPKTREQPLGLWWTMRFSGESLSKGVRPVVPASAGTTGAAEC